MFKKLIIFNLIIKIILKLNINLYFIFIIKLNYILLNIL